MKLRHWRFKKAANTIAMDLCSSTKASRQKLDSIVFLPETPLRAARSPIEDCKVCRRIVEVEMPELLTPASTSN